MMNTKLLAGVSVLALTLGACAKTMPDLPGEKTAQMKYRIDKVEYSTSIIPDWYKKMPTKKGSIYSVGTATAPDLQLAVDVATLNGKVVLADRINGKLKAMTKSWIAKFGQNDVDARVMTEVEKVAKNVIAEVDVAGYNMQEIEIYPAGTQYRAFVLLEYNDKNAAKIIMNRLRKDRMVYSRLRSTKAWQELDAEVNESQAKDEAKSITNVETLIKPKAVPVPKVTIEGENGKKTSG
tara:strand:- start:9406 stop:10116 length:711 start_codon:yes stop_codon:yes gene_type:complete